MNTYSDVINKYQVNGVRYCTFRCLLLQRKLPDLRDNNNYFMVITVTCTFTFTMVNMNKIHKRFHWTSC